MIDDPHNPQATHGAAISQLAGLLKPYRWKLILILIMLIGLTAVNIYVPQLFSLILNEVFPAKDWNLLLRVLGGIFGLYVLRNVLYFSSKFSAVKVGEDVSFHLRNRLFERFQQMSIRFYQKANPGKLSSHVMNDSLTIRTFIQDDLPALMQALLLFIGILITIFVMNWQLAIASCIILPLHFIAFIYFSTPIKQASRSAQENIATATGNLIEKFLCIEVVKGFSGEERERKAFREAIQNSQESEIRGKRYYVLQKVVADMLVGISLLFLFGFGAWQVIHPERSAVLLPGDFIAFFWYIRMLYPAVAELTSGFSKQMKATAGSERIFDVLNAPREHDEKQDGKETPEIKGEVSFSNVCFRYPDSNFSLNKISFLVKPGQVCAIVGHSGSGKTSLASLIPRLNELDSGALLIDGTPIQEINMNHLRRQIGLVFQECILFNASVLVNLQYADPDATREQVAEISRQTGAHRFISKLPNGYDTIIGEQGIALSRGQKQLITLTRAMLKNPKILILDEATASIDNAQTEKVIPAILKLMKGKTTFMITHEPKLLKHADLILKIDEGCINSFESTRKPIQ